MANGQINPKMGFDVVVNKYICTMCQISLENCSWECLVKKSAVPEEKKEHFTPIHDSFTAAVIQKASNVARHWVKLAENQIGEYLGRVCHHLNIIQGEKSKK